MNWNQNYSGYDQNADDDGFEIINSKKKRKFRKQKQIFENG